MIWFLAFLLSSLVAWVATRGMMSIAVPDSPDAARKLHKAVTPTSGGIGIMVGVLAGLGLLFWDGALLISTQLISCLAISFVGGVLGLLDDIYILGPKRKLVVMLASTSLFVILGIRIETLDLAPGFVVEMGAIIGGIGTVFWLLVLVNTVNFMDGANGLSIGCSAIALFFVALLAAIESREAPMLLALIAAGGCLGFLYWNAVLGRIFAGDSGALFVGLLSGALGVWTVTTGIHPLAITLCFLPLLVDTILTIIWRLRRRQNVLAAHSNHAYQRAIRAGASHASIAGRYWLHSIFAGMCALKAQYSGGLWPLGMFAAMLIALSLFQLRVYMQTVQKIALD